MIVRHVTRTTTTIIAKGSITRPMPPSACWTWAMYGPRPSKFPRKNERNGRPTARPAECLREAFLRPRRAAVESMALLKETFPKLAVGRGRLAAKWPRWSRTGGVRTHSASQWPGGVYGPQGSAGPPRFAWGVRAQRVTASLASPAI